MHLAVSTLRVEDALETFPGGGITVALSGDVSVARTVASHAGAANNVRVAIPVVGAHAATGT